MTAATAETGRAIQRLDGRLRDLLAGKKIVMTCPMPGPQYWSAARARPVHGIG